MVYAAESSAVWQSFAIAWALACGMEDFFRRRISNALIVLAMVGGMGAWLATGNSPLGAGWISILAGAGLALLTTLPGYLTRKLGAGDVKLLLAIALLGGFPVVLTSFVIGALVAGVMAVAWLILELRSGLPKVAGRQLPFGTALALGFIVAMVVAQTDRQPWLR